MELDITISFKKLNITLLLGPIGITIVALFVLLYPQFVSHVPFPKLISQNLITCMPAIVPQGDDPLNYFRKTIFTPLVQLLKYPIFYIFTITLECCIRITRA